MELVLAMQCARHFDFQEGVKALLVDKTGNPKWKPSQIDEITNHWIQEHFQSPSGWNNPLCTLLGVNMAKEILFIGLGNMGYPMAINLIKKGFKVHGFDLSLKMKKEFIKNKGHWVNSLNDVAGKVLVVISMLPGGKELKELYLNKQKLFSVLKKGCLIIDCTTANPKDSRQVSAKASELGFLMLDAPVSGGTAGAKAKTLTFIVGGKEEHFNKAKPYFKSMGKNIFYAGKSGSGQIAKVCNNMLLAIHMIGTSEALALGKKMGIDVIKLSEIMKASSGNNWSLQKYNPYPGVMPNVPSSNNYQGGFSVSLMHKDLSLAMDSLKENSQNSDLGQKAYAVYKKQLEQGFWR